MPNFSELVHEAFISPLRSVLIVDDEYPTWEEILNSHKPDGDKNSELNSRSEKKKWRTEPNSPLQIIRQFRNQNPGLIIDIHDAFAPNNKIGNVVDGHEETPKELANHLHQSDLLVLDYNLEGASTGVRGEKAREILNSVLENNHFNLVIVHTGEDNLNDVMFECLISLLESCTSAFSEKELEKLSRLDETLDELEDEDKFNRKNIDEVFTMSDYLYTRKTGVNCSDLIKDYMKGTGKLSKLSALGKSLKLKGGQLKDFLFWTIREFEKPKLNDFSSKAHSTFEWSEESDSKWLRTSKGFVCFIQKGPDDLLEELKTSLVNWKPTPSRLLSAKYRHELNRTGVQAEDEALLKSYVFAYFYRSIREPDFKGISPDQSQLIRTSRLKEHVSRQSESLSFLIENELVDFGQKIIEADEASGGTFTEHYQIDLTNPDEERKAITHYNNYVSTLPQKKESNDQLDTGHVFKLGEEWWVCATPACDMQPGQNSIAFVGESDKLRPFTALKLEKIKLDKLESNHINSGSFCFIEHNGDIIGLGLRNLDKEKEPATQKVTWRTFVAKDAGFIKDCTLKVSLFKLDASEIKEHTSDAVIVTKLRYEYALNYIQRVGSSVSRIGLNYASW